MTELYEVRLKSGTKKILMRLPQTYRNLHIDTLHFGDCKTKDSVIDKLFYYCAASSFDARLKTPQLATTVSGLETTL
jgi:hypothetical protein